MADSSPRPILIDIPDELVGSRIIVRCWREADAQAMWEAIEESRDHLLIYLPWPQGYHSADDCVAFMRQARAAWLTRDDLPMGIFDRSDGRLLGGTGMHPRDWTIRRFELGYWLRRTAVGRGYVSEAVQLLTRLAFDQLQASRVEIRVDTENVRSRAVPARLGFVHEGCNRAALRGVDNTPRDLDTFALVAEDHRQLPWRGKRRRS